MIARLFVAAGLAGAALILIIVAAGWDYFKLPLEQRPHHPRHAILRPSAGLGLACGIAASVLFLLNLAYLLRKRLIHIRWLGSLRSWMAFHIFTGIMACGLVLLHSALRPVSALGILAVTGLGVVIVSGLVGRYIYANVPRSVEGRTLRAEELRTRLLEHRARLESCGVNADLLELRADVVAGSRSLPGRLAGLVAGNLAIRRAYGRMQRGLAGHAELSGLLVLARRFCRGQHWLARYGELRALMGSWRFLHRWLAIVMVVVVLFHVGLALLYGDLW